MPRLTITGGNLADTVTIDGILEGDLSETGETLQDILDTILADAAPGDPDPVAEGWHFAGADDGISQYVHVGASGTADALLGIDEISGINIDFEPSG